MNTWKVTLLAVCLAPLTAIALSGCMNQAQSAIEPSHAEVDTGAHGEGHASDPSAAGEEHARKVLVTTPVVRDVVSTEPYVCQIHSCQHIEVRALEGGYLEEIHVREGQAVHKGDLLFKILPTLYRARLESEIAEANRIRIELENAESLKQKGFVSASQVALIKANLARAEAKVALSRTEMSFTEIRAPFDGIVDRQLRQLGSLIEEGDMLTTISDNSLMWVYFNVSEARYLEYKAELDRAGGTSPSLADLTIELKLANGTIFPHRGTIGAIEANFNNETGNIAFRADFPNPDGLLRHGQTGTILIHRPLKHVVVIPQRATFEILAKRYAFVVDEDHLVHQREISILAEQEDIFILREGLQPGEKIIFEGIRQVRDGDRVQYEFRDPEDVLAQLKFHAE